VTDPSYCRACGEPTRWDDPEAHPSLSWREIAQELLRDAVFEAWWASKLALLIFVAVVAALLLSGAGLLAIGVLIGMVAAPRPGQGLVPSECYMPASMSPW